MPGKGKEIYNGTAPRWFHHQPTDETLRNFKQATVNYILDEGLQDNLPKASVLLCKEILPWLHPFERKWTKVTSVNFNTSLYKAHAAFYDTVRNLLLSTKKLNTLLKEAQAEDVADNDANASDQNGQNADNTAEKAQKSE